MKVRMKSNKMCSGSLLPNTQSLTYVTAHLVTSQALCHQSEYMKGVHTVRSTHQLPRVSAPSHPSPQPPHLAGSTCSACQQTDGGPRRRLSPRSDVRTRGQCQRRLPPGSHDVTSRSQPQPRRPAWNPDVTIPSRDNVRVYLWNARRHALQPMRVKNRSWNA